MEHINHQLTVVSSGLQTQESPPQRSGNENSQLALAIQEEKLCNAPLERLKEVLRLAMVKVGLRAANWPNDQEKAVLIAHVLTNYGGHTAKEISLAFDMAISGKLDLETDEVKCYENFSCLYVSTILNAYRKWAKDAYKNTVKEVPLIEHKEDLNDTTMQSWLDDLIQQHKVGKLRPAFLPPMVYDWLAKSEKLTLSTDERKAYYNDAVRLHREGLVTKGITDKDAHLELRKFEDDAMKGFIPSMVAEAKRMALADYLIKTNV